jgi:hypothetical protein
MFFWLMVWRVLNARGQGRDARALALLAVAACLFTASLEALWIWAYHGYAPAATLRNNFTLDLGIAPAWQVLALGLLVAAAAVGQQALHGRVGRVSA